MSQKIDNQPTQYTVYHLNEQYVIIDLFASVFNSPSA